MENMYRNISLVGVVLALGVILAGVLDKSLGAGFLFGGLSVQEIHIKAAYGMATVTLVLVLLAWRQVQCRMAAMAGSFSLLVLLGLQVTLGIGILKVPNQALSITGHLLLGMTLFWSFFWLYLRTEPAISISNRRNGPVWFARFAMLLLVLQIILGSWVSVHHASSACAGFPICNGQWWPDADYQAGLNFLNGLMTGADELSFNAQVAINWLHRFGGLLCFIVLNALMLVATAEKYSKSVRKAGLWLSFLLFIQVGLGVVGYKFAMPVNLVVAHSVFAALLMLPLIAISFYGRYGYTETLSPKGEIRPKEVQTKLEKVEPQQQPIEKTAEALPADVYEAEYVEPAPESLYLRLKTQLKRTRTGLGGILASLPLGQKDVTEDLLEEIEASLLMADVGMDVTTKIINRLTQSLERKQLTDSEALSTALKQELLSILKPVSKPLQIPEQDKPFVILVIGVNGVGKTTTIGKLAKRLKAQGHSVMLAAGDTFRAAAVEQLQTWGERNNIYVVAQHTGADSASVIYDGVQSAQSKGMDVLIADTAGRLHTKDNLMEELKKVKRIMAKLDETAPHEVILVLDSGTGQNALSQAKLFNEAIGLTGLVLTKLDGTAKGGVIFALAKQTGIPIRFIGVGEGIDDLQDFNADLFVDALFVKD
jgi:fused signal recognition particle receptor